MYKNPEAQELGRQGGHARAKRLSKERRIEIARKAGKERARRKKLGYSSPLQVKKNDTQTKKALRHLTSAVLSSVIEKLTHYRDTIDAIDNPRKKSIHKRTKSPIALLHEVDMM